MSNLPLQPHAYCICYEIFKGLEEKSVYRRPCLFEIWVGPKFQVPEGFFFTNFWKCVFLGCIVHVTILS